MATIVFRNLSVNLLIQSKMKLLLIRIKKKILRPTIKILRKKCLKKTIRAVQKMLVYKKKVLQIIKKSYKIVFEVIFFNILNLTNILEYTNEG